MTPVAAPPVRSRPATAPAPVGGSAAILLLADGRFPAGGHAHSLGYEAASRHHGLDHPDDVERWLAGRLSTTGLTEATLVLAVRHLLPAADAAGRGREEDDRRATAPWDRLDREVGARSANGAVRDISRTQGRQWLRAGRRVWPHPLLDELDAHRLRMGSGPHQVVALAAVTAAAGLDPVAAATIHLHHLVSAVTTAAVRLRGFDPFDLQVVHRRLLPRLEATVARAVDSATTPLDHLPGPGAPLSDLGADDHAHWPSRLFRS